MLIDKLNKIKTNFYMARDYIGIDKVWDYLCRDEKNLIFMCKTKGGKILKDEVYLLYKIDRTIYSSGKDSVAVIVFTTFPSYTSHNTLFWDSNYYTQIDDKSKIRDLELFPPYQLVFFKNFPYYIPFVNLTVLRIKLQGYVDAHYNYDKQKNKTKESYIENINKVF